MTWVVGGSSLFGYGVMLSDVRVTFKDGTEADLVRKAYAVGPFIVAGFAGSVMIGFGLLASLRKCLSPIDETKKAWKPSFVAQHWSPLAAQLFARAPVDEQKPRSHVLMVGCLDVQGPAAGC